jgi:outer membrane protein OmpA-like peptidoglycan-associated protein
MGRLHAGSTCTNPSPHLMKTPIFFTFALASTLHGQVVEVVPAGEVVVEEEVQVQPADAPGAPARIADSIDALKLPPREVVAVERVVEVQPAPVGGLPPEVAELHDARHRAALDRDMVRRQFATDPRIVEAPALPPGTVVETETVVREVGPRRVYDPERSVVVVVEEEQATELPYVTIPVLFVKETAELLDDESRQALEQMAALILETRDTEPEAVFDIEGHTSTDGTEEFNLRLSAERARRVYDELTQRYQVPASMLTAHGFGENYPMHPNGTEDEMTLDRRVLIVRVK